MKKKYEFYLLVEHFVEIFLGFFSHTQVYMSGFKIAIDQILTSSLEKNLLQIISSIFVGIQIYQLNFKFF